MARVKIVFAAAIAAFGLMLAGCADAPESGTVTKKKHSKEYEYVTIDCMARDKKGNCTSSMPVTHHVAATWELCLRNGEGDGAKTGCREVGEITWNRYEVGDHYPKSSD